MGVQTNNTTFLCTQLPLYSPVHVHCLEFAPLETPNAAFFLRVLH